MMEDDPRCCMVVRDQRRNPWKRRWELVEIPWWRRLVDSPKLFVFFNYRDQSGTRFEGSGLLGRCGEIIHRTFGARG